MSFEYDLHIVLPVSVSQPKYRQRFLDFQKYGLWNIGDRRIFVTLLIGTERPELFTDCWHPNVTVEKIECEHDDVGCKTYDYYSKLVSPPNARWHAKIDDDSLNDIDYLMTKFKANYIEEDALYLVTKIQRDCHGPEFSVVNHISKQEWFKGFTYTQHEHEGCFLTNKTLSLILSNPLCKEAFKCRSNIKGGYTDQCLALAARIVGVHPIKSYFLSSEEEPISNYSVFGGTVGHIHPICRDKNGKAFDLLVKKIEHINTEFDSEIEDLDCWMLVEHGNSKKHLEFLLDKEHGIFRLEGTGWKAGQVECLWFTEGRNLQIYNDRGELVVEFKCDVLPIHSAAFSLLNDQVKYTIHKKL